MPTNVTIEYQLAEGEYNEAKTPNEKIIALEKMLSTAPKHKSAEKLLQQIKQRLAKLKQQQEKEKKQKKGQHFSIKKEGASQVSLIGITNSGKSLLLNRLTNADVKVEEYEFTTTMPEIGIMDYHGIKIQLIEIPAIVEDYLEKEKGPLFFGVLRNSDLILIILDLSKDVNFQLSLIKNELKKANIKNKTVLIGNKKDKMINQSLEKFNNLFLISSSDNLDKLKDFIWSNINLIKVYTKQPGKEKDFPPIALKKGSTVMDLAKEIHKDFIKKFKFARIFGKSVKFSGCKVGLEHVLQDDDAVEIHIE
ncbi:TGS domain-containing protein [Candidatus Woesearchaeota archaeon]|nr:TGS domain-containing protein [Candidatus Woesearchaeota archaeon]